MKTNRIIQLAAGVLLLTACTSDFYEEYVNGRVPVNLGYEVLTAEESTRTAASTTLNDATIASGDNITVKIKNNGADASAYNPYNYTAGDGGAMNPPSPKPYYPTGSTNIDILAYYPANAASNFDVAADQTTDDNYKASDLMVATVTNQAKTTSTVALAFQHKMAKLVVTATAGDGVNTIQTITLKNVKRRVTFTNTSGAVGSATTISGSTDVVLFKSGTGTSGTGAALIPAQTIEGDVLEIVTDQGTATYNVGNSGKTFNANTKYTISVTVNRTAVGATNTITWGSEASATIQPTVTKLRAVITPEGAIPGLFTINADGDQVFFSQGNLQYKASTGTWRFAENQYDYVGNGTNGNVTGSTNASINSNYSGWIDLFGWGTSGWNNGNAFYQPYSSSNATSGTYTYANGYGYGPTSGGTYTYSLTDSYANADWGVYNAISNGGNSAGLWRTLTKDEWKYVFNTRSTTSGVRYAKATVNGVSGVILLPDDWSTSYYSLASTNTVDAAYNTNSISSSDWSSKFEAHGAVFLPAAGKRSGATVSLAGLNGHYWSTTASGTNYAYFVSFRSGGVSPADGSGRCNGFSVRLVRPAWYKEASSATASDIGKIICSNGHIHTNVSDVACGGTASAMIAYVGSVPGYFDNFLAIALTDAHTTYTTYSDAQSKVDTYASNHAVTVGSTTYNTNSGSSGNSCYDVVTYSTSTASNTRTGSAVKGWRIPTVTDWRYIFAGIGGPSATSPVGVGAGTAYGNGGSLRSSINTACGNSALQSSGYWSSSELSDNTDNAWAYYFGSSYFIYNSKANDYYVRAVFAY